MAAIYNRGEFTNQNLYNPLLYVQDYKGSIDSMWEGYARGKAATSKTGSQMPSGKPVGATASYGGAGGGGGGGTNGSTPTTGGGSVGGGMGGGAGATGGTTYGGGGGNDMMMQYGGGGYGGRGMGR